MFNLYLLFYLLIVYLFVYYSFVFVPLSSDFFHLFSFYIFLCLFFICSLAFLLFYYFAIIIFFVYELPLMKSTTTNATFHTTIVQLSLTRFIARIVATDGCPSLVFVDCCGVSTSNSNGYHIQWYLGRCCRWSFNKKYMSKALEAMVTTTFICLVARYLRLLWQWVRRWLLRCAKGCGYSGRYGYRV